MPLGLNFPGPYGIELTSLVQGETHVQNLNVNVSGVPAVGDDPTTIDLLRRSSLTCKLQTAMDDWVALLAPMFGTDVQWTDYTLWKYEPLSTARSFVTAGTVSQAGTHVDPTNLAHQLTMTFKTFEGNNMRLTFLETASTFRGRQALSGAIGVAFTPVRDFVLSDANWILARDTSYPISGKNLLGGENEAVFKARFR